MRERVLRYRIMRHEVLPERHQAAYRERGINPDNLWSLVYSFESEEDAKQQLGYLEEDKLWYQSYKIVDGGSETFINAMEF